MSLLIHFSVEQFNSEIELNAGSEASSLDRLYVPSPLPSPQVAPVTPPRKIQSSLNSSFPVTLKAYTEAPGSWKTKDELDRKLNVRGFTNYRISYAQKTPESLEKLFAVAETMMEGAMGEDNCCIIRVRACHMQSCINNYQKGIIQQTRKGKGKSTLPYTAF